MVTNKTHTFLLTCSSKALSIWWQWSLVMCQYLLPEFLHRMTLCKSLPSTTNHNISRISTTNKTRITMPLWMTHRQAAVITLSVLDRDISSYLGDASPSLNHRALLSYKCLLHITLYKKCDKMQLATVTGGCYTSLSSSHPIRPCPSDFIPFLWTYSQWLQLVDEYVQLKTSLCHTMCSHATFQEWCKILMAYNLNSVNDVLIA